MLHTFNRPPDIHSSLTEMLKFSKLLEDWMTYQQSHIVRVAWAAKVWNVDPDDIVEAVKISPFLVFADRGGDDVRLWTIGHGDP